MECSCGERLKLSDDGIIFCNACGRKESLYAAINRTYRKYLMKYDIKPQPNLLADAIVHVSMELH